MKNTGEISEEIFKQIFLTTFGKAVYLQKFTDTKMVKGANKIGFAKAAPADFIVTEPRGMYYAEVKSTTDKIGFKLAQFTNSQLIAMKRQAAAGGKYFVFIHSLATDTWYKIEAQELTSYCAAKNKQSITWKELEYHKWTM